MKIRQLFAKDALRYHGAPKAEHLFAVDDQGRVWERFSDDEPGVWSEVPGPQAKRTARARVSKGKPQ
jgi:hypothetical protein